MIAGPPVRTSVLPSSFAGIGGAVRFTAAALDRPLPAPKTKVAIVFVIAPYFPAPVTDDASVTLMSGRPVSAPACARLATSCGCGWAAQGDVPESASQPP